MVAVYTYLNRGRKRILTVALLIVLVCILYILLPGDKSASRSTAALPSRNEVVSIRASAEEQTRALGLPGIAEFTIPSQYIGPVMYTCVPGKIVSLGPELKPLGTLKIISRSGVMHTVEYYDAGKSPLCYKLDGFLYTRSGKYQPAWMDDSLGYRGYIDEGRTLFEIVRILSESKTTAGTVGNPQEFIDDLRRSRGELPPLHR